MSLDPFTWEFYFTCVSVLVISRSKCEKSDIQCFWISVHHELDKLVSSGKLGYYDGYYNFLIHQNEQIYNINIDILFLL